MNRGSTDRVRDAVSQSIDAQEARAEKCPGCGMEQGSNLGAHYVSCPEIEVRP